MRYGDEYMALCAPLLGSGISASLVERLFYQGAVATAEEPDPAALARHAWQAMLPVRRDLLRAGAAPAEVDSLTSLKALAQTFVAEKLPVWRALGIV